jgi:hypothetical protein
LTIAVALSLVLPQLLARYRINELAGLVIKDSTGTRRASLVPVGGDMLFELNG